MQIKVLPISILFSLLLFPLWNGRANVNEPAKNEFPPSLSSTVLQTISAVRVAAVGDIMMGTDYPSPKLPEKDGMLLFETSKDTLRKADIVFGNLEGPLCKGGTPAKKMKNAESYVFRTPPEYVRNLVDAGFNVLSLANNHAGDFGYQGMSSTKKVLKAAGIQYASKEGEVAEFEINGVKIGLISFSFGPPPRSIIYPEKALEEVEQISKIFDLLILSVHGGGEGGSSIQIKNEFEYFLDEPRGNFIQFAHEAVERGADLILGHGPHAPRALEIYRGRLIAYSLGNFCTYQGISLNKENGYAPLLWVELDRNGGFIQGKIYSFTQTPPGGPHWDEQERAYMLIKKISQSDFPETSPLFDPPGMIFPQEKSHPSNANQTPIMK